MALVVLLRGVNVGGHRALRPSVLARALAAYRVVNIGAAGTFVVHLRVAPARLRAAVLSKLPFEAEVIICDGRALLRMERENPFGTAPPRPDIVRFVSFLARPHRTKVAVPFALPAEGPWSLRVLAVRGSYVFGEYRRHLKAIGYLGKLDGIFGAPATTRNWNTVLAVVRALKAVSRTRR